MYSKDMKDWNALVLDMTTQNKISASLFWDIYQQLATVLKQRLRKKLDSEPILKDTASSLRRIQTLVTEWGHTLDIPSGTFKISRKDAKTPQDFEIWVDNKPFMSLNLLVN